MQKLKTVVITGATSGIGKLLAKTFADMDYTVFAGYRNVTLKNELVTMSDKIIPFRIDMSKKWTISEAIKFITKNTNEIDLIINAAGCVVAGPIEHVNVDQVREQFEVNTFSHLEFNQGLFPLLVKEDAKIINISSMSSYGIFPFISPYCASKRALDILFNSMRIETKNRLKIVSVKPGVIKTPLWEKSIEANLDNIYHDDYVKESELLLRNAQYNSEHGLDAQKVVDVILKIEKMKNPKPSYTVGTDAKIASLVSKLPQCLLNNIISSSLRKKIKNLKKLEDK